MKYEELQAELVSAMKQKNKVRKNVIADMMTCAKNMAIEAGNKDNITEDIVNRAILKSEKMCQDQIDSCPNNRPDLMEGFQLCMTYIQELKPPMLNALAVKEIILGLVDDIDLDSINKGGLMKIVMPELKGKADGKTISAMVDEVLREWA